MTKRKRVTTNVSPPHYALLKYMVGFLSITREESITSLLERLVVAYAKQMITSIKDDAYRGKMLELINNAEKYRSNAKENGK